MKRNAHSFRVAFALKWIALVGGLSACGGAGRIDERDHAIDTYTVDANVAGVAEARARRYWMQNSSKFPPTPYLAVDATLVFPSEVQNLWPKLINSETTASFFGHGLESASSSELQLYAVLIFDTRAGQLVSNRGYLVVDLPSRGSVARFGPYLARYIGEGR